MEVRDLMQANVVWVTTSASVKEAAALMRDINVGSLPVLQARIEGGLVGVITDRDIVCRCVAAGLDPAATEVGTIMSTPAVYCLEEDALDYALHLMKKDQVRRLPVCDTTGRLKGMLTFADVALRLTAQTAGEVAAAIVQRTTLPSAA